MRALGLCRPSQVKCWGPGEGAAALGSNREGGRALLPPLNDFASLSPHRTTSAASPSLSPACPAWCLGLLTFLRKMWVCCKGELRKGRK